MKAKLILASTALCLGLAASSQAQKPTVTAARAGGIPQGGGIVGVQGAITNTSSSDALTITADTITLVAGSVNEDFIQFTDGFINSNLPLVINPGSSFVGFTSSSASNRDPNNNGTTLPNVGTTPYLFTVVYSGSSMPTDPTTGTVQLSYTLGTNPFVFTDTFIFPASPPPLTPEPGMMALMGSGLVSGGLFLARRRSRK